MPEPDPTPPDVDRYVAGLTDTEFAGLVARTRTPQDPQAAARDLAHALFGDATSSPEQVPPESVDDGDRETREWVADFLGRPNSHTI
ncbi:MAG: hypothetical protein ACRD0P_25430 [Stackebrandtia sp.]